MLIVRSAGSINPVAIEEVLSNGAANWWPIGQIDESMGFVEHLADH
jgi:hypothetical protein